MIVRKLLIPLLIILSCNSCKKNSSAPPSGPDVASIITITVPASGVIYPNGSTLRVDGTATDDNGLSTVRIEIKNKATGVLLYQQQSAAGSTTFYRFVWNWVVNGITSPTVATVRVIAKDLKLNEISKLVEVTLDN